MENDSLSVCGVRCTTDCKAFGTECKGCVALEGRVSWAKFYGRDRCPIYDCVHEKKLTTCAHCGQAPCRVWTDTRNPEASDEEFKADINSRMNNLKSYTVE
jgi:hypothetical protein